VGWKVKNHVTARQTAAVPAGVRFREKTGYIGDRTPEGEYFACRFEGDQPGDSLKTLRTDG
jgi:hypothetical protein